MSENTKIKMLEVARILFLNGVSKEQSKYIGAFIEEQNAEIERLKISLQAQEELTMSWYNKVKECREYIEKKEKDDDSWIDYELLIEPIRIKKILDNSENN